MAEKLSMVIGVFEQPLELFGTLEELLSLGFSVHNLCISASRDTMSMAADLMSRLVDSDPDLLALFRNTQAYPAAEEGMGIVGSRGSLLSFWRRSIEASGQLSSQNEHDGCARTWQRLTEKIIQGCLILMVQTTQTYQLSQASTLFLQRSADNVRTVECRSILRGQLVP